MALPLKTQRYFYILPKLISNSIYNSIKKNEIFWHKFNNKNPKALYTDNYKILMNEIKKDQNEGIHDFMYWKTKVSLTSKLI